LDADIGNGGANIPAMQADSVLQASVLSALVEGPQFVCVHDSGSPLANYVSPSFLALTGLPADAMHSPDLIARLVHPDDYAAVEDAWARAERGGCAEYEFRLRYPDGAYHWMSAVARAVPGEPGDPPRFVITAQDIDERKRLDRRLQLLVRAGEIFHQSLDIRQTLANVAHLAVEEFADLCIFDLMEGPEELHVTAMAQRDPELQTDRELGSSSKIEVPATCGNEVFGNLTFVLTAGERYFDADDVDLAKELGRRAGAALANARQYTRERHVAATLQRAFIPEEFPLRPGLFFDALYRPGKGDAEIGGDWYDAFETRRGHIVVAIGDVTGNGVEAAQTMVQLRQAIRVASVRTVDPSAILQLANDALFVESHERFASAWVGVIPPAGNVMHYASAGHPPPFVRNADGSVGQLPQMGQLLGVAWECVFRNYECALEPGMLLALYTDGLTEIARDVTAAEREIAQVLRSDSILAEPHPAETLERAIVRSDLRDDLAILTLRFS
jgi:PAS domain S-box-containing protein